MKTDYFEKFINLNVKLCNDFKTLLHNNNKNKFGAKLEDINKCM